MVASGTRYAGTIISLNLVLLKVGAQYLLNMLIILHHHQLPEGATHADACRVVL